MNSGQAIGTFLSFVHCGGAELRAAVRPNGLGAARERGHEGRGEEGDEDAGHDSCVARRCDAVLTSWAEASGQMTVSDRGELREFASRSEVRYSTR